MCHYGEYLRCGKGLKKAFHFESQATNTIFPMSSEFYRAAYGTRHPIFSVHQVAILLQLGVYTVALGCLALELGL
jgi:hypothetical protein